jgi:hypothetical protein
VVQDFELYILKHLIKVKQKCTESLAQYRNSKGFNEQVDVIINLFTCFRLKYWLFCQILRLRLCVQAVRVPGYRSRGFGFDSRHYQILWEVVGLERSPLSLVSTIEELLGRNSSGLRLEIREYGRGDPFRWLRGTLYTQNLALTSPTSGGRSVGIVRSRTKATEFVCFVFVCSQNLPINAGIESGIHYYYFPFKPFSNRQSS